MTARAQNVANSPIGSYPVRVNNIGEGDVQTFTSGFEIPYYDYVGVAYPTASQEVYTFKTGGSGGTTVATITLNYTDATKESLTDATRT